MQHSSLFIRVKNSNIFLRIRLEVWVISDPYKAFTEVEKCVTKKDSNILSVSLAHNTRTCGLLSPSSPHSSHLPA